MDVEIKQMPELRVAAVRHIGPYSAIGRAFGRLNAIATAVGLFQRPGAKLVGIYYDDPGSTPPERLRSDAGVVVPSGVVLPEGLVEQRIPAGRYASTEHRGPYEQLGDMWGRLMNEWLPTSGHRVAKGPNFEIYLNTPGEVPKEQLRTELYLSLE